MDKQSNFNKKRVIGVLISACSYETIIRRIIIAIEQKKPLTIAPLASHAVMLAKFDKKYKKILNSFHCNTPDSFYIKWALNFLYGTKLKERIYGPHLMDRVISLASRRQYRIGLYGPHAGEVAVKIREIYPTIQINLEIEPPQDLKVNKEAYKIAVQEKQFDLLFIGVGTPQQHYLMNKLNINRPVISVGAAFDFISKKQKQAPLWMQNNGLEWLFRFFFHPVRLWKRYLLYSPLFLVFLGAQKVQLISRTTNPSK